MTTEAQHRPIPAYDMDDIDSVRRALAIAQLRIRMVNAYRLVDGPELFDDLGHDSKAGDIRHARRFRQGGRR